MRDAVVLNWTGTLSSASSELTDEEVLHRFGPLMEEAVSAFQHDPSYVVQMAEAAASLKQKRARRAAQ